MSRKAIHKNDQIKFINEDIIQEYLDDGWLLGKGLPAWNKNLDKTDPRVLKNILRTQETLSNKNDEEKALTRTKISKALIGRKLSPETITKRSATVTGCKRSEEHKRKTSMTLMGHPVSQETRDKISKANKGKPGHCASDEIIKRISKERSSIEWQTHHYQIKKQNGTLTTSKPEEIIDHKLQNYFTPNDIIHIYRDNDRYPFNCDFYIKSLDLFIELNLHWTHGFHPFNPNDPEDTKTLEKWKSKNTKFYNNAIYVWTDLDVRKQKIAKENNLNYLTFYKMKEFDVWFGAQANKSGKKHFLEE